MDFEAGLCGCFDDCNICLCSFFCPCIQVGHNWGNLYAVHQPETPHVAILGVGKSEKDICCKAGCGFVANCMVDNLFSLIVPTLGLFTASYQNRWRQTIRTAFGYRERSCNDFLTAWCCMPCSIAQEGREIKNHLISKGISPRY